MKKEFSPKESMQNNKRITIICGHYGSGKTSVALNLAFYLKKTHAKVTVADLDIVNPYFRARDGEAALRDAGIRLICSPFANSNLDVPALPQELYAITDDRSYRYVLDIGGDDRGALALGRLSAAVVTENDYETVLVVNRFRPLTRTASEALEVLREIETASGIRFCGIVNNSNLGVETTAQTVLDSLDYAEEISRIAGLPIAATTVREDLCAELAGRIPNLFPLKL